MNEIKLYNELKNRFLNHKLNDIFDLDSNQFNSHDMVEFATAIGIKLLELASETAKTKYDESSCCGDTGSEYEADIIIDKDSILNTINQLS